MSVLPADLRFAFRSLWKAPAFSLAAILTLGLGIGVNTAILSAAYGVLLRPLDLPQPERLYSVGQNMVARGGDRHEETGRTLFTDWRARNRGFARMAFLMDHMVDLTDVGPPENVAASRVSHEFFAVLGVRPALGRDFLKEEETKGGEGVAIISDGLWRRRFGGDRSILGKQIMANGSPLTIVGILPAGFRPPVLPRSEIWVPMVLAPPGNDRGYSYASVIGRLKPGLSPAAAQSDMDRVAAALAAEYPDRLRNIGVSLLPLRDRIAGSTRTPLLLLLGAALLVLLIACVNVGNLVLIRTIARRPELALRLALGAGRGRLVRLFVAEGVLITLGAAAVGLVLGTLCLTLLRGLAPPQTPRLDSIRLEGAACALCAAAALVISLLAGLLPAAWTWRRRPFAALRESAAGTGRRAPRLSGGLVVAEIGASIVLLMGAGVLLHAMTALTRIDPGFRTEGTVVGTLLLPFSSYPEDHDVAAFLARLEERLGQWPGIAAAGLISNLPLAGEAFETKLQIEGQSTAEADLPTARFRVASPGFFRSVGLLMVAGRSFQASDVTGAPPVALVSQRFVRRYLAGENPVGKRIRIPESEGPAAPWRTVVGVVGDFRGYSVARPPEPEIFIPMSQVPLRELTIVARSEGPSSAALKALQDVANEVHRGQVVSHRRTMAEILSLSFAPRRFVTVLTGIFAALSLALAAVGIYGVAALAVARRRKEIAVRLALGAPPAAILRMILRWSGTLVVCGVLLGAAGWLALSRIVAGFLYGVEPLDGPTVFAAVLGLAAVAFSATLPAALRAGRTDAAEALKSER